MAPGKTFYSFPSSFGETEAKLFTGIKVDPAAVSPIVHLFSDIIDLEIFRVFNAAAIGPAGIPAPSSFSVLSRFFTRAQDMKDKPAIPSFWQEEPIVGWRAWQIDGAITERLGFPQMSVAAREIDPIPPMMLERTFEAQHCRLKSVYHPDVTWEPRVKFTAKCDTQDKMIKVNGLTAAMKWHPHLPDEACECGIYAFRDLGDLLAELHTVGNGGTVIGRLAMWGRTIESRAAKGYRAQFAYPLDLGVIDLPFWASGYPDRYRLGRAIARNLEDVYGVPCTFGNQPGKMLGKYQPPTRWPSSP